MGNKEQFLKDNGIDITTALTYLGDMETFDEILHDFYVSLEEQMKNLEEAKDKQDMANYAILVHALKSNCRSLGIDSFADICYQHELQSKENNLAFVQQHYVELVNAKEKFIEIAKKYFS